MTHIKTEKCWQNDESSQEKEEHIDDTTTMTISGAKKAP